MGCGRRHEGEPIRIKEDLTGRVFGRLTVIGRAEDYTSKSGISQPVWICKCECGNIVKEKQYVLKSGSVNSCGCLKSETTSDRLSLHIEGQKFGKLTVLKRDGTFTGTDGTQYSTWTCQCDCGTQKVIKGHDLVSGKIKSCGCLMSFGESEISRILSENNIIFIPQFTFPDLISDRGGHLRFDFAITDNEQNLIFLLEYQGIQHYVPRPGYKDDFGKMQREITDKLKKEYCLERNIKLEEITYKQDIEKELISILKKYNLIK